MSLIDIYYPEDEKKKKNLTPSQQAGVEQNVKKNLIDVYYPEKKPTPTPERTPSLLEKGIEKTKSIGKSIVEFGTELTRGFKVGIPQATSAIKKTGSDILGLISKGEKASAGTVFDPLKIRGALALKLSDNAEKLRQSALNDFKKSNLLNAELPIVDSGNFLKNIQDPKWLGRNIGQNLPNLATSLGVSTITTALTANPAVGLAVGFGTSFSLESGFAYMDAKEAGVDEDKANKVALITGIANGVLDSLPLGRLLGKLGTAQLVRKSITKEIVSGILKQTALESSTESIQQIVSNAVSRSYDKDRNLFAGVPESFFIGGVLGGVSSVAIETPMELIHKNSARIVKDMNNVVKAVESKPEEQRTQTEKDLISAVKGEVTFKPITTQDRVLPEIPTEQVAVEVSRAKQPEGELTPDEWKGKEIVHVGNRTAEQAKIEGLHEARNPQKQFGKAVYFGETTEAVSDFGTNVQAKINTDDFNLKVFNSVKERTDFLKEQEVDNLADGIRKEGEYDGFIVTNPDPAVGNYYGITNLEKVNAIVTGKQAEKPPTVTTEAQKTEGLEPAKYSETNLIVKEGDYIVDRDGVLKTVTKGNDKYIGDATNEGFIRSAEIGGKPNIYEGKEIGYMDYANQIRKATPEEIAQTIGGEITSKPFAKANPEMFTKENIIKQLDETGSTPIDEMFFHVRNTKYNGVIPDTQGGNYLSKGRPFYTGQMYAIDTNKLNSKNLFTDPKTGYTRYKGDIPKDAYIYLGEWKNGEKLNAGVLGEKIKSALQGSGGEIGKGAVKEEITAKDLVESKTVAEIQDKLQKIFGTYEELEALEKIESETDTNNPRTMIADEYMADIERAATDRDYKETEILLNKAKKELAGIVEKGEIKAGQDIKDLDAQIRTIKEPTKENPNWVVEIGLQESLGEQGGDIVTWDYDSKPTLEEVRKDILEEYRRVKKEVNKEVAMGITAKSGREEMIEEVIDKVLALKPQGQNQQINEANSPQKTVEIEGGARVVAPKTKQSKVFQKTDVQKAFKALKTNKTGLPILDNVKVKDGKLMSSNLNVLFSIPTDKEDGLYKIVGSDMVKSPMDISEYPIVPEPPKETAIEILPDKLADLLKKASLAVETGDQRPTLQGIQVVAKDGQLSVVSTDGYRLFHKSYPAKTLKDMTINISDPNDLQKILGLLPEGKIAIKADKELISFQSGDVWVTTRNISGEYPAWNKIMGNYQEQLSIDKKALSDAVKAIKPYVKDLAYVTSFEIKDNEMIVKGGKSTESGGVGIKEVKISIKKKSISIPQGEVADGVIIMPVTPEGLGLNGFGLNNKFVSDMIDSTDGDTLYMSTASKDGIIEPRTPKFFSDEERVVKKPETPIVPPTPQTTPKKETPETYKGDASVGWFADVENVTRNIGKLNVMEFPEMLRLAKELLDGVPMVKMTRAMKNAFEASGHTQIMGGMFRPVGKGKIIMNPEIFKNPSQTAKTLSHEMGHLTDFIPEGTMARGNLLGRLASLKKYMSNFLPETPGGKGELTEKDRARLRRQAVKEAQMPVTVEEEIVVGEAKATPKEIIAIWNDMSSGITTPDLLKYIQTLDSRQKVEIVKEAMKGTIPAWVTFVNKIKKTITHDVIKNAPEDIRRIYKKLLEQEVEKRRLFYNETIKKELKGITEMWRPYDPQRVSVEYEKYRNSSKELYADAISVLLNDPARLERDAPTFFKAFFNYIDRKQEFRDNFFAIQEILNKGDEAVFAERDKVMEEAYKTAEDKFFVKEVENRKRKSNLLYIIQSLFDNKNQSIWNKVREAEKNGVKVADAVNPAFEIQGLNYLDAFTKNFIADTFQPVFEESQQVSNGWVQLGKVLQLERAIYERGEMANPQGYDPKTAQDQLNYLKTTMSEQDWNKIMSAKAQFRTSVKKFIEYAEKNKFYTPELLKTMKANPAYSAFQVIDYLDTYLSSRVYKSVGTLKDVANTATSTVMKMISVIRAVERNKVKVDMTDFLTEAFPKEIEPAETRYAGKNKAKEILEPRDKDKALVITIRDGKPVGHYVDKEIGKSLNNATNETINMVAKLSRLISGSSLYRPLFTTVNLGFQTFNFFRDFSRYWKNVPDYTLGKALTSFPRAVYRYAQAVPHAISRASNKPTDIVKAMENSKILGLSFNDIFREPVDAEDMQIDRILQKVGVLEKTKHKKLLTPFYWVLDKVDSLGNFIESLPKIAGYIELKGQGRMSEQEMAQFIRTKLGSPDFRTTGYATSISNNIFLFSNAIKEGIKSDFQIATGRSESGRYSQSSFWWKTVLTNFLPTLITVAAGMGLLGKWYEDRFNDISEYDKTNYTILPLGVDENGKTVYLRVPRDETGRFYGGIFYKLLKMMSKKELPGIEDALQVFSFGAGQFPTLSPNFTGIGAMVQYMSGQNPYDTFRGQNVIKDREFQAGFKYSFPVFMKWLLQNQGMGIVIPNYVNDNPSKLEKMVGMPVVSNVLGRWIKTSDYGKTEQLKEIGAEVKQGKAVQALEEDKMIADAVKTYKKSGDTSIFGKTKVQRETVKAIMNSLPKEKRTKQKQTLLTKEIQIAFVKGEADANLKSLIYATSNDEKADILKSLKTSLSSDKYNELKKTVLKYKIVNTDVFKKVK